MIEKRHFHRQDSDRVSEFLIRWHEAGNADLNWLQPAWEYALTHPALDEASLAKNTVWEENGEIVGIAHFEHRLGEAFFQVRPDSRDLVPAMLDVAEVNLRAAAPAGHVYLRVYVDERDLVFRRIVGERGYIRLPTADRPLYERTCDSMPEPEVPEGFSVQTLAEENDLAKMDRVLWRGFDHEGEPPEDSLEGRKKMQSGPNWRADLATVAVSPAGDFAAYCGMWYVAERRYAYVEPVATDPEFRRQGLGRAVVLEGLRRCAAEGASVAYVGSDLEFYRSLGFTKRTTAECWIKHFQR